MNDRLTNILIILHILSLESHNQLAKMNRERHTYRGNRLAQMEQWFHASLDGSDPLILEHSLEQRLKLRGHSDPNELPPVVHNMVLWDHPWNNL